MSTTPETFTAANPMKDGRLQPTSSNERIGEIPSNLRQKVFTLGTSLDHGDIDFHAVANSAEALSEGLVKLHGEEGAEDLLRESLKIISKKQLMHDGGGSDDVFSVYDEDDLSREQLQIIKAKTMFNMVEEMKDGKSKLLFLTHEQAEIISKSPIGVKKMLDALEVEKPSLVIEMLMSSGFRGYTNLFHKEYYGQVKSHAGILPDSSPFLSMEEEQAAEERIDRFMADVIIPLAAETHAVVVCNCVPHEDVLSTSFLRM